METVGPSVLAHSPPPAPQNTPATAKKAVGFTASAAPANPAQELKAGVAAAGASPLFGAEAQLCTNQLYESPPGAGLARQDSWRIEAQRSDRMEAPQPQQAAAVAPALSGLGALAGDVASPSLSGAYTPASGGWLESARKVRAVGHPGWVAGCLPPCLLPRAVGRHALRLLPQPPQPTTPHSRWTTCAGGWRRWRTACARWRAARWRTSTARCRRRCWPRQVRAARGAGRESEGHRTASRPSFCASRLTAACLPPGAACACCSQDSAEAVPGGQGAGPQAAGADPAGVAVLARGAGAGSGACCP